MGARHDFTIDKGATLSPLVFTYEDANGDPIDLTGYTARLQVREKVAAADTLLDVTPTVNGPAGTVTVTATAAQTGAMPAGSFPYALELTSGATVIRLVEGAVEVTPEVVRT